MMMRHDKRDEARDIGFPIADATCNELRTMAWSYLDDELPRAERRWIRAHLIYCEHCSAYVHFLRAFLRLLRTELTPLQPDEALQRRIRSVIISASSSETDREADQEPSV
jgi:anti-sigma factor RsiW